MFECYLFSQFACTTVCGTPSEILCALHHLTAEKGAASPVLERWGDLQVLGTGRHKGCFHFFTVLKNSCVKGFVLIFFFYVFVITLVPRCPPLFKCKLSSLGPGCGACGGRQLTSDHIDNVPRSAPSPTVFQFSLVVNTGMFIRWLGTVVVPPNGTRYNFLSHLLWEVFECQ